MAPSGTPASVVALLNREFNAALAIPAEVTLLAAQGFEPGGESPEAFGALLEADAKKWGALIRDAGLKAD
jgi:tripartite-type tricarboxylate transporter receptor subunit TctC